MPRDGRATAKAKLPTLQPNVNRLRAALVALRVTIGLARGVPVRPNVGTWAVKV